MHAWGHEDLFEPPPGIPAGAVEDRDDPERTVVMHAGDLEESEQLLRGFDPEALVRHTRHAGRGVCELATPSRRPPRRRGGWAGLATGPGARFVVATVLMAVSLGGLGLALSWPSRGPVLVAGVLSVVSGVAAWALWRAWLAGSPHAYRLMASLGEDAENLADWRCWRVFLGAIRSVYR